MNNKIKSFTLAEVVIVLAIIGVVATMLVMVFRPKFTRNNIFQIRATLYNIEKANEELLAIRRQDNNWGFSDNLEDYCNGFADLVNVKSFTCSNTEGEGTIVLPNKVEIKGLYGEWASGTSTNETIFSYKDIEFDTDGFSNGKKEFGMDKFEVRILKNDPYVIPMGDFSVSDDANKYFLNEDKLVRYRVISLGTRQNGVFVPNYKIIGNTEHGVSYGHAACLTGLADVYLTKEEKDNIASCPSHDAVNCENYFDCKIQLMDVPSYAGMFTPRK